MASGRSALGQDSSRAPPEAGAGRGRSKVPVPLQLEWLCDKRTVLATLTQDIVQQAKFASNNHLMGEDPPPPPVPCTHSSSLQNQAQP